MKWLACTALASVSFENGQQERRSRGDNAPRSMAPWQGGGYGILTLGMVVRLREAPGFLYQYKEGKVIRWHEMTMQGRRMKSLLQLFGGERAASHLVVVEGFMASS